MAQCPTQSLCALTRPSPTPLPDCGEGCRGGAFAGRITPIEYKRGRPKRDDSDRVQLCAQALCLEEMLNARIECGALFYGKRQRRTQVEFDEALRCKTEAAAARLHAMIAANETPPAVRTKKCDTCSLLPVCLPEVTQASRSASRFCGRQFAEHLRNGVPTTDSFDAADGSVPAS